MAAHSESRPSSPATLRSSATSRPDGRSSWNPYLKKPDLTLSEVESMDEVTDGEREAIPPSEPMDARPSAQKVDGQNVASIGSKDTHEIIQTLSSLTDKVKDGMSKDAIVDTVKTFAKSLQHRVAKLGGIAMPKDTDRPSDVATSRFSMPARNSVANSLDGYRPDRDVVAPISVRPNAMELLWVCGDCGQHYPRARECPEECKACGAPKQHFYAPIED
jgi:hypothetical protein